VTQLPPREAALTGGGRDLCGSAAVDYRRPSRRATISPVACGCSAVGSASPCQGEGRGFESRHPLEGAVASTPAVEWPSGEATACKAVHTGSIPVSTSKVSGAISSAGERFPDTEEVTGSIPVSRTSITPSCSAATQAQALRPTSGVARNTVILCCSNCSRIFCARRGKSGWLCQYVASSKEFTTPTRCLGSPSIRWRVASITVDSSRGLVQ
jgi:hypothetical protein